MHLPHIIFEILLENRAQGIVFGTLKMLVVPAEDIRNIFENEGSSIKAVDINAPRQRLTL